jgi:hypothetical protein
MASKAAFTANEWDQVLGSVFMAGFAVTAADPSGLWGLPKEMFASGRAFMEAKSSATAICKMAQAVWKAIRKRSVCGTASNREPSWNLGVSGKRPPRRTR